MNFYLFIPIASFLLNGFIWVYVFAQGKKSGANKAYLVYSGILQTWLVFNIIIWYPLKESLLLPMIKINSINWLSVCFLFLNFTYSFLRRKRDIIFYLFMVCTLAAIGISLTTNLVIDGYIVYNWGVNLKPGYLFKPISMVVIMLPGLIALILLLKKILISPGLYQRKQIGLVFAGSLISLASGLISDVILPIFLRRHDFVQVAPSLIGIQSLSVFIAIVKYRFLSFNVEEAAGEIFDSLQEGVILFNHAGHAVQMNTSARDLLGTKSDEIDITLFSRIIEGYNFEKEYRDFECPVETENGNRFIAISQSPIHSQSNRSGKIVIFRDITDRKKVEQDLRKSQERLRSQNVIMVQELEKARLVQEAIMPVCAPESVSFNIDFRHYPFDAIGGDFFSFSQDRDNSKLGIFIGDISGHGVSSALFTSLLKSHTDRFFQEYGKAPSAYLAELNRVLLNDMKSFYMTGIYGFLKKNSHDVTFTFARGGHPYPILYRKNTGTVEFLKCGGTLLGMFPDLEYRELSVTMEQGDRVFFYTDGIVDIPDNSGSHLSFEGFRNLVGEACTNKFDITLDTIMDNINDYRQQALIEDDVLIIGVEIK